MEIEEENNDGEENPFADVDELANLRRTKNNEKLKL